MSYYEDGINAMWDEVEGKRKKTTHRLSEEERCNIRQCFEHCYMGMCIANSEWREAMRKTLFDSIKGKQL